MYLRTTRRKNRDGSIVSYLQLAHNVWDREKQSSKTTIVHNFGRTDQLDRQVLIRLCRSIAKACGVVVRIEDPAADVLPAGHEVLREGVIHHRTRPVGTVWAVEALWERLGIGPALRELQVRSKSTIPYERALFAMVANRLDEPTSKLGVWDRWLERVHLPSAEGLKLSWMYEAMDLLQAHQAEVEERVFFETANLLNLEVDLIFYDTTTCSFAVDVPKPDDEDDVRKLGYSKEGTWTPQVVVALAVTREGLPVRSWVLPGNTTDVTTVKRVRDDLRGWKLGRTLFVADSGMNSEDNRAELAKAGGRYVLACRAASVTEVKDQVLGRAGRYKELAPNLRVKEVVVDEGERRRRYILCHNPAQAKRQAAHRGQVLEELEAKLSSHPDKSASAKWAIKLRASGRYGRYLAVTKGGKLRIDRAAARSAARLDGKWVLITNDDTLSVEDAAQAYKGLLVIERCFRTLKSTQIEMRPMFHWLPRRIEAHVKLCVFALLIERVAERACGRPWPRLRRDLDQMQVAEYRDATHRIFRLNADAGPARSVLIELGIKPPKPIVGIELLQVTPSDA